MERANHQIRTRDHDRTQEKHWISPTAHSVVHCDTSDQSNWHSSPGAVPIRVDAAGDAVNLGPLRSFRCRATVRGDLGFDQDAEELLGRQRRWRRAHERSPMA
jgi:hypothetical protein